MAKKRVRSKNRDPRRRPSHLEDNLERAISLERQGRAIDALEILSALDRRYPDRPEVLSVLANVYLDLKNHAGYLQAMRRLYRLKPDEPDVTFGLARAYLINQHFAQGYLTLRQFLRRWPEHKQAKRASQTLREMEKALQEDADKLGMPFEEAILLLAQNDEIEIAVLEGDIGRARKLTERVRREFPQFVSPLNNLSLAYWVGGDAAQAIATARQVLEVEPENVHALGNLIQFLFLSGREEEARALLPQLRAAPIRKPDEWTKKMEALTLLGEEEEVVAVGQRALAAEGEMASAQFYLLLAAAEARRGDIPAARRHWKQALKRDPGNAIAQENLKNIQKKPEERYAPWTLPLIIWMPRKKVMALTERLASLVRKGSEKQTKAALARFLEKEYPELLHLALPMLLRGDPASKDFVLEMADVSGHPTLLAALKEYAFGKLDPLSSRVETATILIQHGVIPKGVTRFWVNGEWQSLILVNFALTGRPSQEYPMKPAALAEMEEAIRFLRASDGKSAEKHLRAALAIQPNHPSILNNLAFALTLQGREAEATEIIHQVAKEFPDYFFGQIALARAAILHGELEKARAILEHWLQTKEEFHLSEFSTLCQTQIDLALAEGQRNVALSWLQLWEKGYPDDTNLPAYRRRVKGLFLFRFGQRPG